MADYYRMRLEQLREELLELRGQVTALLNDWYPFLDGEGIISEYVRLLNTTNPNIHKTRSDIHVDLGILKDLLPKLEHEHAEAKKEFFNAQLSNIYTYRKRSMVLHELHGLLLKKISDDLRRWIKQLLVADDEWTDILAFSVEREEELMRQEYIIGFSADIRKEEEILRACSDIPQMCQSVENLLPFLEEKCFSMYNEKPSSITVSSVHCQKWFLPRVDILAVRLTWRGRG
ncbi:uncharacterized protein LOC113331209 isoform X4 [Papaver somniferum]|uniref:uncharacterized protein LOC113331209 isoform X4 n=1 Tax=Papaver somniferum TaxID=3469 RepID=UPI000E6F6ED0|nr:uncharacterized protein LOC113331209 isoform X4 [Papaver somniferum]